jgi:hypothetical protein
MTTLFPNVTTVTNFPTIVMLAFATTLTSFTSITFIPLSLWVSKRCADFSYHFLFKRGFSVISNWGVTPF